jgi:hypothetical protein
VSAEQAVAPRWALCSDCRFEGLPTCPQEQTCWYPIRTEDLPREPAVGSEKPSSGEVEPGVLVRPPVRGKHHVVGAEGGPYTLCGRPIARDWEVQGAIRWAEEDGCRNCGYASAKSCSVVEP